MEEEKRAITHNKENDASIQNKRLCRGITGRKN